MMRQENIGGDVNTKILVASTMPITLYTHGNTATAKIPLTIQERIAKCSTRVFVMMTEYSNGLQT